ncbi:FprA family A-type flavoprotein [Anaerospora sp.]|uniref:FprA family A-type flavoprotein n=1 Tax=Anaerospora sp. TaxID=1960278 RepID=UPI0028A0BFD6|nr:FprA family A-type flavoprotein [Anaerospora sp.]
MFMYYVQAIAEGIYWVGGNDRRLERFENMFPIPQGVAYNSYLMMDEKTVLVDTVDSAISALYLENVMHVLGGRPLDYLVVNHMEPDHCANIEELVRRYPDMKIVGNTKTFQFLEQFYSFNKKENYLEVKEGDELAVGKHTLQFFFAPMVHWPEVMVTYEQTEKILFSADAFGSFGAHAGTLFSDQVDFEHVYLDEARRYYANIVGKYGVQVQAALKKLSALDIHMICSVHGPIWRKNLDYILDKYNCWSRYEPEQKGVVLLYASMYGNTENVMNRIAGKLAEKGVRDMRMYDVSKTHPSYIIADAWKYSHMVIGAPTYNMGLYFVMEALLHEMAGLNFQNRKVALVGNYTWACKSVPILRSLVESMKKMEIIGTPFEINSSMKAAQEPELDKLVEDIYASLVSEGYTNTERS